MNLGYLSKFSRTEFLSSALSFFGYDNFSFTPEYIPEDNPSKPDYSSQFSRFQTPVTFFENPNIDYALYDSANIVDIPYYKHSNIINYHSIPDDEYSIKLEQYQKIRLLVSSKTASTKAESVENAKYECFAYAEMNLVQIIDALRNGRAITSVVGDGGKYFSRNWRMKTSVFNGTEKRDVYIRAINTPLYNPDKDVDFREDGMLFRYMIRKEMFLSSQIIIVDIDDISGQPSIMELVDSLRFKPTVAFSTMSDNKMSGRKFRLLYVLDRPVESPALYSIAAERLNEIISESKFVNKCDKANKNVAQLFFGTTKDADVAYSYICYNQDWIYHLATHKFLNNLEMTELMAVDPETGSIDFEKETELKEKLFVYLFVKLSSEIYGNANRAQAFRSNRRFLLYLKNEFYLETNIFKKYGLNLKRFGQLFEINQSISAISELMFRKEDYVKKHDDDIPGRLFNDFLYKYENVYEKDELKESLLGQVAAIKSVTKSRDVEQHDKLSFIPEDVIINARINRDRPEYLIELYREYTHSKEYGQQLDYASCGNSFILTPVWFVKEYICKDVYRKGDDRKLKTARQIVSMRLHDSTASATQIFLRILKWVSIHIEDDEGPDKKVTLDFLIDKVNQVCQTPVNELRKKYIWVYTTLSEWSVRKNNMYHRSNVSKREAIYEFLDYVVNCNLTKKDNIEFIKRISGIEMNEQYITDYCQSRNISLLEEVVIKRRNTICIFREIFQNASDADDAYARYIELKRTDGVSRLITRKTMDYLWKEWTEHGECRTITKMFSQKIRDAVSETEFKYSPDLEEKRRITRSKMRRSLNMTMNAIRVQTLLNADSCRGYFQKKNKGVAAFELLYDKLCIFREFVWSPGFIGAIVNRDPGAINRFFREKKLNKDVFNILNFR